MTQYERVFYQKAIHSWEEQSTCSASHITENTHALRWTQVKSKVPETFVDIHLHEHPCSQPCLYYSRAKKLLALRTRLGHRELVHEAEVHVWKRSRHNTASAVPVQTAKLTSWITFPLVYILRSMSHWFGKESGNNTKRKYFLTHILSSLGTH